jgi:uncharacterized protein YukE
VILQVDPTALTETARPLRQAVDVARQVEAVRGELAAPLARAGSEPVRRAAEAFLDAWAGGLRGVSDRAEALATALDTAAASYADAEQRTRRAAAGGPDGSAT